MHFLRAIDMSGNDDHRAGGMVCAMLARAAQQQPGEASVAARSDHEEVSGGGRFEQCGRRSAEDQTAGDSDSRRVGGGKGPGEDLGAGGLDVRLYEFWGRGVRRVGKDRVGPGVNDLDLPVTQTPLVQRQGQRPARTLEPSTPTTTRPVLVTA